MTLSLLPPHTKEELPTLSAVSEASLTFTDFTATCFYTTYYSVYSSRPADKRLWATLFRNDRPFILSAERLSSYPITTRIPQSISYAYILKTCQTLRRNLGGLTGSGTRLRGEAKECRDEPGREWRVSSSLHQACIACLTNRTRRW